MPTTSSHAPAVVPHSSKELFPVAHLTKQQLADYYRDVATHLLPHIRNRPLTFKVFPEGIARPGHFRKHLPAHFPAHVERVRVPRRDPSEPSVTMALADAAEDLVYFAGQNIVELHVPLAETAHLDLPDQVVFDLDPPGEAFELARRATLALQRVLKAERLASFVKLSGRHGLHVHVPITPEQPFELVRGWTKRVAETLCRRLPKLVTTAHRKADRAGRVYLDITRNAYGQTVVAPYSVRGEPGGPIALPVDWSELRAGRAKPGKITLVNLQRRLAQKPDPWRDFAAHPASLSARL